MVDKSWQFASAQAFLQRIITYIKGKSLKITTRICSVAWFPQSLSNSMTPVLGEKKYGTKWSMQFLDMSLLYLGKPFQSRALKLTTFREFILQTPINFLLNRANGRSFVTVSKVLPKWESLHFETSTQREGRSINLIQGPRLLAHDRCPQHTPHTRFARHDLEPTLKGLAAISKIHGTLQTNRKKKRKCTLTRHFIIFLKKTFRLRDFFFISIFQGTVCANRRLSNAICVGRSELSGTAKLAAYGSVSCLSGRSFGEESSCFRFLCCFSCQIGEKEKQWESSNNLRPRFLNKGPIFCHHPETKGTSAFRSIWNPWSPASGVGRHPLACNNIHVICHS